MSNVEGRVKKIIAEQLVLDEGDVQGGKSFVADLVADSLDILEIVMALEEEFGFEIPGEDVEEITTVQQAIDYVVSCAKI